MSSKALLSYPAKIPVSKEKADSYYVRLPGYVAIHHEPATRKAEAVTTIGEGISVLRSEPGSTPHANRGEKVTPVYVLGPGAHYAVPTGLVFVRCSEGAEIGRYEKQIQDAGYEVARKVEYAPNSAWLRARSGDIDDALNGLNKLENIPQIENIEPQMLMASVRR